MHPQLKVAPAMGLVKGANLVAVYSRSQERAEAFAENHDFKAANDSVDEMLKDSRVDAVFVASPNALHAGHTLQAARAGKHVLTEKPQATTVQDALSMVRACRSAGVKLGTGFELWFNPGHILARNVISEGSIGRISLAQGQWGRGTRGERFHIPRTDLRGWWEQPELMGDASVIVGLGRADSEVGRVRAVLE
jgi:predicted dehydrogenase